MRRLVGTTQTQSLFEIAPSRSLTPAVEALTIGFFLEWWACYPRKEKKQDALKAWLAIRPVPDRAFVDRAIEALRQQMASARFWEDSGRWIPLPASWLRAGRWDDEPLSVPAIDAATAETIDALRRWVEG
jgi:hypothetical protein